VKERCKTEAQRGDRVVRYQGRMSIGDIFKSIRKEYERGALLEEHVAADPLHQFRVWFDAAVAAEREEPNACALATVGVDLQPSVRMVLLKSFDDRGFIVYTNYHSAKGRQIEQNPRVSLLFYWPSLERQVRIEGRCERVSSGEADAYFAARPRGSQLGSAVSRQSEVAPSRQTIDDAYVALEREVGEGPVPRPAHWGGYLIVPTSIEFWQGRESRLHDRLRYTRHDGAWEMDRLWP
jgi:pyridoxamine 5'-phosphate oxidase